MSASSQLRDQQPPKNFIRGVLNDLKIYLQGVEESLSDILEMFALPV